jgi:NTE family protein
MKTLGQWLSEKPFTLDLSAGFFGFFAHLGMVKALLEAELRPVKWAGCSAGAIVASAMASGCSVQDLEERLVSLNREHFWDPHFGIGLLKGEKFESLLNEFLPSNFESLKEPLEIAAFDIKNLRRHSITSGPLPPAVRASGAVPVMFRPVSIDQGVYYDGGITLKTALHPKRESGRVLYHFLHGGGIWDRAEFLRHRRFCHQKDAHTLVIKGLPKLGPFRLQRAEEAIQKSYQETKSSLVRPLPTHQ